ncbi:uncharacterized protein [Eleutherodactylus coqui]|uniref:uncharacterized protein n=1 Tax=Eleutherodactylus coqui TaxID=57060 RepID=UPI003462168A
MDPQRSNKLQNIHPNCRPLTPKYPGVQSYRLQKLPSDEHTSRVDARDLCITGISVSRLRDQNVESRQKVSTAQHGGSNMSWAQTSGWRLKPAPVENVPIICSYSRPLHITLHGRPLIPSSSQAQHLLHQFGRPLAAADSESWWNYRFAAYSILSRNAGKPRRALHRITGYESHSCDQRHRQEATTRNQYNLCTKPLLTHVTTQTQSPPNVCTPNPSKKEDPNHPPLDRGGSFSKTMRNRKSDPLRRPVLPISPSGVPVISLKPWPSPNSPEEDDISITVPLLPKLCCPCTSHLCCHGGPSPPL